MNPVGCLHVQVPLEVLCREDLTAAAKLVWGYVRYREVPEAPAWPTVGEIADAVGASRPTVQAAIKALVAAGLLKIVSAGGGYSKSARYRTILPEPTAKNLDSKSHSTGKEFDSNTEDTVKNLATTEEIESQIGEEEERPPPSARPNPDNDDSRLLDVFRRATGRPASNGSAAKFLEAVREARAVGATDALIALSILDAGRVAAPWIGPNAAREAAKTILKDFARLDIRPPRKTITDILQFVDFCCEQLGDPEADGDSSTTWRRVTDWADAHAEVLRRAATWPAPSPAAPAGRAAR